MVAFKDSVTKENLMRAFAGESQARNRYTFAAAQAKTQKLQVIEKIFTFTADQEKEHAEIFWNHLKEVSGETINVDGGYPVDITNNMVELLKMSEHNEFEEYSKVYKAFGDKAKEEGFPQIANSFYMIAEIEKTHGERFKRFAELLEKGELFSSKTETKWLCLNCGHIHSGKDAPKKCPVCSHDQGYFIRLEQSPFEG